MKYLQIHGGYEAPQEPPTLEFLGDGIVVAVASSLPWSSTQEEPLGVTDVRFFASGPNAEAVLTELLLQPLAVL